MLLRASLLVFRLGFLLIFLLSPSIRSNTTLTARPTQNPEQDVKRLEQEAAKLESERKYDQAISVLTRALELREKAGGNPLDVAVALSTLGELSYAAGNYDAAITFMSRALAIREKTLPPDDTLIAESASDLAALYVRKGDLVSPEPMLRRALSIQEKKLGPNSLDVARTLNSLATLYDERGDRKTAEPLFKRSLAIREKELGEKDRLVANSLNNLARLYMANRDFENAEPLYKRSLKIREAVLGPDDPQLATPLINLATLYYEKGEFAEAETLFLRALRLQEKGLSSNHPALINTLHNLAEVYRHQRRFDDAELLYKRSLDVAVKSLGTSHSLVATVLRGYALLEEARGDFNAAASFLKRAINIQEHNLTLILTAGSQAQKLLYLRTVADETDLALSLHLRNSPDSTDIARLAFTTILQRKGRVLDVMSASIEALRQGANPEDLALINQLAEARDQLAKLTFSPPTQSGSKNVDTQTRELEARIAELEAEISTRSSRFRSQSQLVTLERVQQAIPVNSCLIEFVSYRPFEVTGKTQSESFGPLRYAAYILKSTGAPSWVSLGDAAKIDRAVSRFRRSLASPSSTDHRKTGRALDALVMRPIRRFVGLKQRLFISPDGALNLTPFAALIDERGRYLTQRYVITYLSSGRDLLRLEARAATKEKPVVVANPVFDDTITGQETTATQPAAARNALDFRKMVIKPLPETALEAEEFKKLFPNAKVFTGIDATEAVIKKVSGPVIFHVATHGFFMSSMDSSAGTRGLIMAKNDETNSGGDPLLRSGLLLAGASLGDSGPGEDGILTALEVANLNLWGTQLAVLSACETGLGDVYVGEGVFGLRRALVLAGAESQVISLWKVSDRATRELMGSYYRLTQRGAARSDALREVQSRMINGGGSNRDFKHPFYWAAFIQSGFWGSM